MARHDETLDLEGQRALLKVLRGLGTRDLAVRIGRYEVGDVLGTGACGQVYAAHDPELDRDVAIKVVLSARERPDPDAEARLLREAAALARLQDPNVVPVYDVGLDDIGAGTGAPARRGVYVVMARIRGRTLQAWLRTAPRDPEAIVRVFVEAARGLAAAHAVGVVHRDFKPGNAMVTDDGAVVVLDFGLARALDEGMALETERSGASRSIDTSQSFTATGTVVGTPRYMAPEQHSASGATPAVDQYAWCVALWEALAGAPPFEGKTLAALAAGKRAGRLPAAPAIPGAVRGVLARGLRPDPQDRWPSLRALCEALERRHHRRARRVGAAALGAFGVGATAVWGISSLDRQRRLEACREEAEAITAVYDDDRAARIGRAFAATGLAYASETWQRAEASLRDYAAAWTAARGDVCRAATVERTLPAPRVAAATACLDDRRAQLSALVDRLAEPDAPVVLGAASVSASLPPVASCTEPGQQRVWAELPADPAGRSRIVQLRTRLAEAIAARAMGRHDEALREAEAVIDAATALGDSSLAAEARLVAADAHEGLGDPEQSRQMAEQAFFEADAAGRDDLALRASSALVFFVGNALGRHDDALEWGRFAQIRAERADADPIAVAGMLSNLGSLQRVRGEGDEALALHERARGLYEETLGPEHPRVAVALNNLGNVHHDRGELDRAAQRLQRALEIDEAALGAAHPSVAAALNNLGVVEFRRGAHAHARDDHERALAIREAAFGPDHPDVAVSLNNLGAAQRALGEHDEALRLYTRALAIREGILGPEHPDVAVVIDNIANLRRERGELETARTLHLRALQMRERSLGPEHRDVGSSLVNLGFTELALGEPELAIRSHRRALAIFEASLGAEHPLVASALENLGDAHEAAGDPGAAAEAFARALAIREAQGTPDAELAALRFGLARTLWEAQADRGRAVALANAAAVATGDDPAAIAQAHEIDAWIASRPQL